MSGKDTEKEREKIESKGAYSFDLHDAIRDVRKALGSGSRSVVVQTELNSLFDILAPEIREAVNDRWEKKRNEWANFEGKLSNLSKDRAYRIDNEYFDDTPLYFDSEFDARDKVREKWDDMSEVPDEFSSFAIWDEGYLVSDGDREFFVESEEEAEEKKRGLRSELRGQLPDDDFERLRILFRIVIDALDNHGELRKWRDVEYGKV